MLEESYDDDLIQEVLHLSEVLEDLETKRMFSGEMDSSEAYLKIQAGSGGTEAQDFSEILLRMYLRYASRQGYCTEIVELTAGDVAGIKSATVHITKGEYPYGYLRTETGVHRLVRPSPFDSGNRRHTSFASVYVTPVIPETKQEYIKESDIRVDRYKASGKGGQHVNTTDSAVRLTHIPTGIVVACQSERSQHSNYRHAMKQLQSEIYLLNERLRKEKQQGIEDSKDDITWGSQIRSYVLDDSRVKDLRTNYETRNTEAVLNGELNQFIHRSLKMDV